MELLPCACLLIFVDYCLLVSVWGTPCCSKQTRDPLVATGRVSLCQVSPLEAPDLPSVQLHFRGGYYGRNLASPEFGFPTSRLVPGVVLAVSF